MSENQAPKPRRAAKEGWVEIYRDPDMSRPARALDFDESFVATDVLPKQEDTAPSKPAPPSSKPTIRASRPKLRESAGLKFRRSVFYTLLSTLVIGLGLIGAPLKRHKALGIIATTTAGVTAIGAVVTLLLKTEVEPGGSWVRGVLTALVGIASSVGVLHLLTVVLVTIGIGWVALIAFTQIKTRPQLLTQRRRVTSAVLVGVLSLGVALPTAVAAQYTQVLTRTLGSTFAEQGGDAEDPRLADGTNPFTDVPRVNILLLGSDMDSRRLERSAKQGFGLRTDTLMVASIDTKTGDTAIIQIPRNVQYTPFPDGSEMARTYPNGYTGDGDPAEWFINSLWERVSMQHPELFVGSAYPGAEALKQGIEGITGLPIHYFVLLNMDGLQNLIDAMGGVTVNINERIPIGGSTKNPVATGGYLEVGPDQHLDGYHALWYARSRWADSNGDYGRMARQSCLVGAIIDQANPTNLLTRFEAIAGASSQMTMTDIPSEALQPLTALALKVKDQPLKRLVFSQGKNGYLYSNPDFEAMRQAVQNIINPPPPSPKPSVSESPSDEAPEQQAPVLTDGSQDMKDACAFNPVEKEE